ncbi:hypothetical protein FQN57_006062 [Myotisia sp. PD_48]|nr:hypothetical protein FQN57_006062 [Myotisia sp. PD_48]
MPRYISPFDEAQLFYRDNVPVTSPPPFEPSPDYGNKKQPALVFLHGWPMSSQMFERMTLPLCETYRFRCIAPDRRGFGKSDYTGPVPASKPIDHSVFAMDVTYLLEKIAVGPFVFVAASMGPGESIQCYMDSEYVRRNCKGFFWMGAALPYPINTLNNPNGTTRAEWDGIIRSLRETREEFVKASLPAVMGANDGCVISEETLLRYANLVLTADALAVERCVQLISTTDFTDKLKRLGEETNLPIMCVHGDGDKPDTMAEKMDKDMAPAKRQRRKAKDLTVPDISDDAAERKRVLNVLAQRRYRQRKREHLAALTARMERSNSGDTTITSITSTNQARIRGLSSGSATFEGTNIIENRPPSISTADFEGYSMASTGMDASISSFGCDMLGPMHDTNIHTPNILDDGSNLLDGTVDLLNDAANIFHTNNMSTSQSSESYLSSAMGTATPLSSFPSPPPDFQTLVLPDSPPSPRHSSLSFQLLSNHVDVNQVENHGLSSTLQIHQSSNFTFPDDKLLEVPTLPLLRAVLTIATRLNLTDHLWNPSGISPFYTGPASCTIGGNSCLKFSSPSSSSPSSPSSSSSSSSSPASSNTSPSSSSSSNNVPFWLPECIASLPAHFRPTATQRLIPHHAFLDLLPWPNTRDKLIQVFSIPPHLRPPSAADAMGFLNLIYDMEDPAEGLRVCGSDPFSPDVWEVGQVVFQRWWWAFEGSIIESSNRLRRKRGERGLVLGTVE